MPTDTGLARSNYFRIKDEAAFREWADKRGLFVAEHVVNGEPAFAISRSEFDPSQYFDGEPFGDWDGGYLSEDGEEDDDGCCAELGMRDIAAELAEHLAEGSVAVLLRVGSMKLQDVTAKAVAVNSGGQMEHIHFHDAILEKATSLGTEVTPVEN